MPTIISAPSFTTQFTLNVSTPVFKFTDITDYAGNSIPLTNVFGVFKITSPSGVVIYNNTNYSAPDITRNSSAVNSTTIPLPGLSNSYPEAGNYTIVYSVQINDGSNPTYVVTDTNSYDFEYAAPTATASIIVDCIAPLLTASDTTDYDIDGATYTSTRTLTLQPPANSGGSTLTNTTSATITTSTYYTGLSAFTISTDITYTFTDGLIVVDTIEGTQSINVDCSFICDLYCCLKTLQLNVQNNRGIDDAKFQYYKDLFEQVMGYVEMLFLAIDCGKQTDANNLLVQIQQLAQCTGDCGCTDGTPRRVTGLGFTNVNVAVQSGGAPITVTSAVMGGITTYTVSFDAALTTKLNNSYNTVVAAGTNTTVTSSTVGSTTTYTVNASFTSDNLKDSLQCRCAIDYSNVTTPTVSITVSDSQIDGTNLVAPTIASVGFGGGNWGNENNLFIMNAFMVTPNNTYKVFFETIQMDEYADIDGTVIVQETSTYTVPDQIRLRVLNEASGVVYFQFVDMTGVPLSNAAMVYVKDIILNILIRK
jgi:hypothetical protein